MFKLGVFESSLRNSPIAGRKNDKKVVVRKTSGSSSPATVKVVMTNGKTTGKCEESATGPGARNITVVSINPAADFPAAPTSIQVTREKDKVSPVSSSDGVYCVSSSDSDSGQESMSSVSVTTSPLIEDIVTTMNSTSPTVKGEEPAVVNEGKSAEEPITIDAAPDRNTFIGDRQSLKVIGIDHRAADCDAVDGCVPRTPKGIKAKVVGEVLKRPNNCAAPPTTAASKSIENLIGPFQAPTNGDIDLGSLIMTNDLVLNATASFGQKKMEKNDDSEKLATRKKRLQRTNDHMDKTEISDVIKSNQRMQDKQKQTGVINGKVISSLRAETYKLSPTSSSESVNLKFKSAAPKPFLEFKSGRPLNDPDKNKKSGADTDRLNKKPMEITDVKSKKASELRKTPTPEIRKFSTEGKFTAETAQRKNNVSSNKAPVVRTISNTSAKSAGKGSKDPLQNRVQKTATPVRKQVSKQKDVKVIVFENMYADSFNRKPGTDMGSPSLFKDMPSLENESTEESAQLKLVSIKSLSDLKIIQVTKKCHLQRSMTD